MKIKYRLVIVFIFIILISSLPLALYILGREEREKISLITSQGVLNTRVLARSTMNILLGNGGDIPMSKVDAREMMEMFAPLSSSGLIRADCAVISARPEINGLILAGYTAPGISFPSRDRIDMKEISKATEKGTLTVRTLPGIGGKCYEFTALGVPAGKAALCLGRLVFSEEIILEPISRVRRLMYILMAAAILLVSVVALVFSRFISQPIEELTSGVANIDVGDLGQKLPVRGRDEIGKLATTFNHMLTMIDLHLAQLVTANRELQRLDLLKDEFLANTSHELRSPISGMIGLAESLLAGSSGPVSDTARRDLDLIVHSGRRLTRMVNDILDFSRLKNRDIALELEVVDVHAVAELVFSILRPMMDRKGIEPRNLIPPENLYAEADPNRLQQIIMNLAGNAVKFTDHGAVSIAAEAGAEDMITITVEDTGIGIPGDKLAVIFEPFEQADGSISRVYGGSGLGLSIVKKLVELHGGSITVDSKESHGSRFSFTLRRARRDVSSMPAVIPAIRDTVAPAILEDDDAALPALEASAKKSGSHTILVVDDDPVILRVLTNYLELEGYSVKTALSGGEALEMLDAAPVPDLIILDVMLPRLSGYDVARAVRKKHPPHSLPIIMLTARNMPADVITGIQAGANDYLVKPVHREELAVRVTNLVAMKESAREHHALDVLKRDLVIAHEIQESLILSTLPAVEGATLAVRYHAMAELGGDFYDIQALGDGVLAVLIADVSGHGIGAALICSMLKVAYAFHLEETTDPAALLRKINVTMSGFTHGQFITAFFALVDTRNGKFSYANAGHWPAMIVRKDVAAMESVSGNGIPFGWSDDYQYEQTALDLMPGDRIIFYTDGLVECRDAAGSFFGTHRMIEVVEAHRTASPEYCADAIMRSLREWSGHADEDGFGDDVTLIITGID